MPSYHVTARRTGLLTPLTVEAESREQAIAQVVATAAVGESIEVLQTVELPSDAVAPTGATGTSR